MIAELKLSHTIGGVSKLRSEQVKNLDEKIAKLKMESHRLHAKYVFLQVPICDAQLQIVDSK